jgi:hypothetical protein
LPWPAPKPRSSRFLEMHIVLDGAVNVSHEPPDRPLI